MLWTFLIFVLVVLIVGFVSFWILEILVDYFVSEKIYHYTTRRTCGYLMEHGRGFFEEHNHTAILAEQSLRVWLVMISYVFVLGVIVICVSSRWSFWVIPRWSIKIGCLLGALVNGYLSVTYEASVGRKSHIGRLMAIDDKNVGEFAGLHEDDFEVWLEGMGMSESDIGKKYFVLGAGDHLNTIMYSLELD